MECWKVLLITGPRWIVKSILTDALRKLSFTSSVPGVPPLQAWSGKKLSVNNLKVFGCAAYSHISKDEKRKLSSKVSFLVTEIISLRNDKEQQKIFTQDIILYTIQLIDVSTEVKSHGEAKETDDVIICKNNT